MLLSKLNTFLLLGLASALTFSGSAIIGLTLAFDSWRVSNQNVTFNEGKIVTVKITQGIRHECYKNDTSYVHRQECHPWYEAKDVSDLLRYHELLIYLVASSSICGALSLIFSLAATTSRVPKCFIQVTCFELVAVLMGFTALMIYSLHYIKDQWSPSYSYFCLWIGIIFLIVSLIIHTVLGDVKFFGKKFFVTPTPAYRYHKGNMTLEIMTTDDPN